MFNRTTSTKFFAPRRPRIKIRIPKLEISNKPKHSNLKIEIQNEINWNFMFFDQWDLFRISDFEFRICNFTYTWRALRLCGSPRGVTARPIWIVSTRANTPQGERKDAKDAKYKQDYKFETRNKKGKLKILISKHLKTREKFSLEGFGF